MCVHWYAPASMGTVVAMRRGVRNGVRSDGARFRERSNGFVASPIDSLFACCIITLFVVSGVLITVSWTAVFIGIAKLAREEWQLFTL